MIATNEDSEATSEDTIEETSEDSSDDTKEDTSDDPATSENASEDTDRLTRPAHKLIPCQEIFIAVSKSICKSSSTPHSSPCHSTVVWRYYRMLPAVSTIVLWYYKVIFKGKDPSTGDLCRPIQNAPCGQGGLESQIDPFLRVVSVILSCPVLFSLMRPNMSSVHKSKCL